MRYQRPEWNNREKKGKIPAMSVSGQQHLVLIASATSALQPGWCQQYGRLSLVGICNCTSILPFQKSFDPPRPIFVVHVFRKTNLSRIMKMRLKHSGSENEPDVWKTEAGNSIFDLSHYQTTAGGAGWGRSRGLESGTCGQPACHPCPHCGWPERGSSALPPVFCHDMSSCFPPSVHECTSPTRPFPGKTDDNEMKISVKETAWRDR